MDDRALWICELTSTDAVRFASLSMASTVLLSGEDDSQHGLQDLLEGMNTHRAESVAQSLAAAAALCEQQGLAQRLADNLREMAEIANGGEHVRCAPEQRRSDGS